MKYLPDLDIAGRRVLLRVDFNVPLHSDGSIADDTRLQAAVPTLNYILAKGGSLVLMSHLGRPKGIDAAYSLRGVSGRLQALLGRPVDFVGSCVGQAAEEKSRNLPPQALLLLENLRFYAEETAADIHFAEQLAHHGEVYVNDAFGTAHRAHASTSTVARFFKEKGAGLLIEKELRSLERVLHQPARPMAAIVGGAKISDKIGLLSHLAPKVDKLLVGGGMSHTFVKALGGEIGDSLIESSALSLVKDLHQQAQNKGTALHLPTDSCIAESISPSASTKHVPADRIPKGWKGLDIGPQTIQHFTAAMKNAKTLIWNGPMGVAELPIFAKGTEAIAQTLAALSAENVFSLVGGGDSIAALKQLGCEHKVSHLSTGGGAMLTALEGKGLPALEALEPPHKISP